jgi:hypothetical protein
MTQHSDSFQADGQSLYGFLAESASITVGGRFTGQTLGAEGFCDNGDGIHGQSAASSKSGVWGDNTSGVQRSPPGAALSTRRNAAI